MTVESNNIKTPKILMSSLSKISTALAIAIAVAALLVSSWLFYTHQQVMENLNTRLELQQAHIQKMNTLLRQQAEQIKKSNTKLTEVAAQLTEGKQAELLKRYRLGDIGHIIQLANQKLLIEHDPITAITLLEEANQGITQLNDPTLRDVSDQITSDLTALKAINITSVNNLYTELNTLIEQAETLSITPSLKFIPTDNSATADQNASTLTNVLNWLGQYIKIKNHNEVVTPLLTPEESVYVKHNIIVLLEQAQWSALRRETGAYQDSLTKAEKITNQYAAKNNEITVGFIASINKLKAIDIAPIMPDISNSLRLLEKTTTTAVNSKSP